MLVVIKVMWKLCIFEPITYRHFVYIFLYACMNFSTYNSITITKTLYMIRFIVIFALVNDFCSSAKTEANEDIESAAISSPVMICLDPSFRLSRNVTSWL